MSRVVPHKLVFLPLMSLLLFSATGLATAQPPAPNFKSRSKSNLSSPLGRFAKTAQDDDSDPVTLTSSFTVHEASRTGVLQVTAKVKAKWHIYSVTQAKGGPLGSKITIEPTSDYKVAGAFTPNNEPHVTNSDLFSVPVEEHAGTIVWSAPVKFGPSVDLTKAVIPVKFFYQACATTCLQPTTVKVESRFDRFAKSAPKLETSDTSAPPAPKTNAIDHSSAEEIPQSVTAEVLTHVETPEEIVAMAKHYDAESKINYVTLKKQAPTTIVTALIGAFIGGFLLNLMPCVFPVLGIKVMGFVEQAGDSPGKIRLHGLVFTLGLVMSMWALGGFILFLKLYFGQEVSWGQQMGSPYFVAAIIILLFLMGLNMAGVFEFGTSMTRVGGAVQGKKGYSSSFLSGVLTTLIATPCSGPFLGAAMGYTLSQDAFTAMFLFTIFALGIALPYLVLSMFPALIHKLPRPGSWMEVFKVTMAFALFATVAWFMKTFGGQTGVDGISLLAMALVVIALAAYFYGHWSRPHLASRTKVLWGGVLPAAIVAAGIWMTYIASGYTNMAVAHESHGVSWRPWRPGIVEFHTSEKKRPVLVDYTADWCLTCQFNEKRIFSNAKVLARLNELGVLPVIADMTDSAQATPIKKDLARADRRTISTYLVYPANYPKSPAILLEELISPDEVLEALERIQLADTEDNSGLKTAQQSNQALPVVNRR